MIIPFFDGSIYLTFFKSKNLSSLVVFWILLIFLFKYFFVNWLIIFFLSFISIIRGFSIEIFKWIGPELNKQISPIFCLKFFNSVSVVKWKPSKQVLSVNLQTGLKNFSWSTVWFAPQFFSLSGLSAEI